MTSSFSKTGVNAYFKLHMKDKCYDLETLQNDSVDYIMDLRKISSWSRVLMVIYRPGKIIKGPVHNFGTTQAFLMKLCTDVNLHIIYPFVEKNYRKVVPDQFYKLSRSDFTDRSVNHA